MNWQNTALFTHKSDEYETPQWLFDLLNKEFHFHVDAAATFTNKKTSAYFGLSHPDALKVDWHYKPLRTIFFLNPPYSKISAFMKKAYEESLKGAVVVCLIPCRTDTYYWHDYVMKAQEIRFINGRLKFGRSKKHLFDADTSCAPFPSCVIIFNKSLPGNIPRIGKTINARLL